MATQATTRQAQVTLLFCAQGLMPSGASAMTGNLSQESGRNLPSAFRTGKLDHGSQFLPQWRLSRLDDYMMFVKTKVEDADAMSEAELRDEYGRLDLQVEYMCIELKRDYPKLDAMLRKGGAVSSLTAEVCWQYERPAKYAANLANRIEQALVCFNSIPTGAPAARQTNVVAMLDSHADAHAAQATNGAVAATTGATIGGVGLLAKLQPTMHWWEWLIVGIVIFMIVTGIVAYIMNKKAQALIVNAKPGVDPESPKAPSASAPVIETPATPTTSSTKVRKSAKDAEAEAIAAATKSASEHAEDDAHAHVQQHVEAAPAKSGEATMTIGKAS